MFIATTVIFLQTYPDGYPESLLRNLGPLMDFITPKDVAKWKITSADTLAFLLRNEPPNDQVWVWVCFSAHVCFLVWELLVYDEFKGFRSDWLHL